VVFWEYAQLRTNVLVPRSRFRSNVRCELGEVVNAELLLNLGLYNAYWGRARIALLLVCFGDFARFIEHADDRPA